MDSDTRKKLLVGLVLAAALAAVIFAVVSVRSHSSTPQANQSTSSQVVVPPPISSGSVSTPVTAPGASTVPGRPSAVDPTQQAAILSVARGFVTCYQERSWQDGGPTAWLRRCEPLTTPAFFQAMTVQANSDGTNWPQFVADHTTIAVVTKATQPLVIDSNTYVGVPFTQTITTKSGATQTFPGFLTVYLDNSTGHWLVSGTGTQPPNQVGN